MAECPDEGSTGEGAIDDGDADRGRAVNSSALRVLRLVVPSALLVLLIGAIAAPVFAGSRPRAAQQRPDQRRVPGGAVDATLVWNLTGSNFTLPVP